MLKISLSFKGEGFMGVNVIWRGQEIFFMNVYSSCHLVLKKRL